MAEFNPYPTHAKGSAIRREFGISQDLLRDLAARGSIKARLTPGGHRLYDRYSVWRWLNPVASEAAPQRVETPQQIAARISRELRNRRPG